MWKNVKGYWLMYVDTEHKFVYVHRYVWEQVNGKIPEGYDVHHKNEIKDDNRIDNLELIGHGPHTGLHNKGIKLSDETKRKIGDGNRGKYVSDATKNNISNVSRKIGLRSNNTSGYKGVRIHKASGLWQARIFVNKKDKCLGYFETAEEAARAYDSAARKYFGDDCFQNIDTRYYVRIKNETN